MNGMYFFCRFECVRALRVQHVWSGSQRIHQLRGKRFTFCKPPQNNEKTQTEIYPSPKKMGKGFGFSTKCLCEQMLPLLWRNYIAQKCHSAAMLSVFSVWILYCLCLSDRSLWWDCRSWLGDRCMRSCNGPSTSTTSTVWTGFSWPFSDMNLQCSGIWAHPHMMWPSWVGRFVQDCTVFESPSQRWISHELETTLTSLCSHEKKAALEIRHTAWSRYGF